MNNYFNDLKNYNHIFQNVLFLFIKKHNNLNFSQALNIEKEKIINKYDNINFIIDCYFDDFYLNKILQKISPKKLPNQVINYLIYKNKINIKDYIKN